MASKPSTVAFIVDQLEEAGDVSAKKMFGDYGLFLDGKMFAIVGDDQLFFKPTDPGAKLFPKAAYAPPYPGAKPCMVIPAERWDDTDWIVPLAVATAGALPLPAKKKKKA